MANTLTQPIELSQNPLCPEIRHAGHRGFCNTLFGFLGKFVTNLQADLPSCSPDPTHPLANPSVLPFKPCWQGCWRARAVCLHENQTLLSYQNKARLAVSLSARGGKKKNQQRLKSTAPSSSTPSAAPGRFCQAVQLAPRQEEPFKGDPLCPFPPPPFALSFCFPAVTRGCRGCSTEAYGQCGHQEAGVAANCLPAPSPTHRVPP